MKTEELVEGKYYWIEIKRHLAGHWKGVAVCKNKVEVEFNEGISNWDFDVHDKEIIREASLEEVISWKEKLIEDYTEKVNRL